MYAGIRRVNGTTGDAGECPAVTRWPGPPREAARASGTQLSYAVTACAWSLLVIWMLRGLAASRTGMVKVSTPAA